MQECRMHFGHGWVLPERDSHICKGSSSLSMVKTKARAASKVIKLSPHAHKQPFCSPAVLGTHIHTFPESAGSWQCLAAG